MNLVADERFRTLQLKRESTSITLFGIDDKQTDTKGQVELELWHRKQDRQIVKGTFVIITNFGLDPRNTFAKVPFPNIGEHDLADQDYNIRGPIDGIIGLRVLGEHLREGLQRNALGLLAQQTTFGWIVFGVANNDKPDALCTVNLVTAQDVFNQVRKMWESEELHEERSMTQLEEECEALYKSTLVRNEDRYSVTLLLKPDSELGESRSMARRRLYCLENRLSKNPEIRPKYNEFMDEYERLGHMRLADPLDPAKLHYYIPHHAVSIDRKFRVVFDASAKTSNGKSLNEIQYIGPRLQRDLTDILMKFRTGQFAMTADICKMFRQIEVQPECWDLQRILWRKSPDEPIREYVLTVVTYGMTSSPYLAVKTLQQCAADNAQEFPRAAQATKEDFYVDDLLTSDESQSSLANLKGEVIALLRKGGFELAKWRSNCQAIMEEESDPKLVIEPDSTSVLGIVWNYRNDEFQFKLQVRIQPDVVTKRVITSEAARIFDPQGYLAPLTIRAKFFIQESWRADQDNTNHDKWDMPLAQSIQQEWKEYYDELRMIDHVRIPRWLETSSSVKTQIHVYCDASSKAYGAASYVRVCKNGRWSAKLLCARTRVAPIKTLTIPRLELNAVVLGCSLVDKIRAVPMFEKAPIFMWTDSEIVLHWLRKPTDQLKVFVSNRVVKIQKRVTMNQCRHVRSEENPADLLSRGLRAESLIGNSLWWNGPQALTENNEDWPLWKTSAINPEIDGQIQAESKKPKVFAARVALSVTRTIEKKQVSVSLLDKNESYRQSCRASAYVLRFLYLFFKPQWKKREENGKECPLVFKIFSTPAWISSVSSPVPLEKGELMVPRISLLEYDNALKYWIRSSQIESFPIEYKTVMKGEQVSKKSPSWTLTPQMDQDRILRVYGRLGNTNLPHDVMHPIILKRTCTLARRLADESHMRLCHGGVQACTQYLRNKYWIIGVRILLRGIVFRCIACTRYRQQPGQQIMADLPAVRLEPRPAFEHTGVDYAGPITLKLTRNTTVKGYIAVFVCMVYKAVHLELVSSLDADSCTAALSRFVSLRAGQVKHMYSDNGTNFVKVNRELQEAVQIWQDHEVMRYLEDEGIQWHFNVPSAPHHGGLWEAAVKSMKHRLKRIGGAHMFTFEELATLLAKIAAVLNSRPLTPISSDPNDLQTLTPAHFLTGRPMITPPEAYLADVPTNRLSAWQRIQKLHQEFATRWSNEYITEQQKRNKWADPSRSLQVGDLVFIKTELAPPTRWLMGRIIQTFTGPDGRVRSCEVKTEKGTSVRPVTRLCLLPLDTTDDATSEVGFP